MGREEKYEIPQTPEELEKAKKEAGVFSSEKEMIETLLREEESKSPEEQDKLLIEKLKRRLEHPEEEEKKKKMLLGSRKVYKGEKMMDPVNLEATTEYEYNEEGDLQRIERKDREGNMRECVDYTIEKKESGEKVIKSILRDKEGKIREEERRVYDKNGREIERIVKVVMDEYSYSKYTYKWEYDEKGNLVKEIEMRSFIERKTPSTEKETPLEENVIEYKYDTKGNLIEEKSKGRIRRFSYRYDKKGNLVEKNVEDESGEILEREEYRYDETGKLIERLFFGGFTEFVGSYVYKYDEKGNLITIEWKSPSKEKITSPQKDYLKKEYQYDSEGNLIEERTYFPTAFYADKIGWIERKIYRYIEL